MTAILPPYYTTTGRTTPPPSPRAPTLTLQVYHHRPLTPALPPPPLLPSFSPHPHPIPPPYSSGEIQQLRGDTASSAALVAAMIGRTRNKGMQSMEAAARSAMHARRDFKVCSWV